jgi:predicted O-methyltransferase YrrM
MSKLFHVAMDALHLDHARQNIPSISASNAAFLCDLLRAQQPKQLLEIGTCHGLSACYWGHTARAWGGQVMTLELSALNYAYALQTLATFQLDNVRAEHADAIDFLAYWLRVKGTPFNDGQKSKTLDFFLAVQPVLAPRGVIVVDDAHKHAAKMQTFYAYLHAQNIAYTLHAVDADDATLVIRTA